MQLFPPLARLALGLAFIGLLFGLTGAHPPPAARADEEQAPATRVEVTAVIPASLDDFDDAAVVVILFEFDPRLADVGATQIQRRVIRNVGHQAGVEQTLRFTIGDALPEVRPDRRYYVSCRIYADRGEDAFVRGDQLHYCHNEHDRLPGTVYDAQNGNTVRFTAR